MRVLGAVCEEHEPVERALLVGGSGVPVDVMRGAAHAAVLVVDEGGVYGGAADLRVLGKEIGGGVGVALGVVMCGGLVEQEGVYAVAVPAFDVMVRPHAVAVLVLGFALAVAAITAAPAGLSVVFLPLAVLRVAPEVQRVAQLDAEGRVTGAGLQFEVGNSGVSGDVKDWHLATGGIVLLLNRAADAGGDA